jgi:NADH-ubiquinone oxidoreductase chain 4
MSLYGMLEKLPWLGVLASSSIVLSAGYTIFMFNRISFGGFFTKLLYEENVFDINQREFLLLFILIVFTIILGIYPSLILDSLHYPVNNLIYKL